ncbi:glycosyltransferase [Microbacterium sp.]|uniref:glycosyltransferase n=1 Tax=Microbacterium sp. TaxID=51671 RepID=UPI0028B1038B|nr:glycosyltransferase [Microbacterium sp.]
MSANVLHGVRRVAVHILRRLSEARPARRRAERSLAAPVQIAQLPETNRETRRFFSSEAAPVSTSEALPIVSVVIPVYDSEAWLDDCLSSVLTQSGVALEVLCIDDGSTDASRQVLERYAVTDARVRIIEQANAGQSVARNVGLGEARGRYVIYLDSDDFWRENALASLVARADRERLDVLQFDGIAFRDGEVQSSTWNWYSSYYPRVRTYRRVRLGPAMIRDMRRWGDYRPHVGMYLARTDFVRTAGIAFIPGIVHQDNPYTFTLLLKARRVAHARCSFYARRLRQGSTITTLRTAASANGYFLGYLAMSREMRRHAFDAATTSALNDVIAGVFTAARKKIVVLPKVAQQSMAELDTSDDAQLALRSLLANGSADE